jgi:type IV pilus assembly protein PilX
MRSKRSARGMALISGLMLLLVMTILGIAMFRSFGTLERIAGNTREKQRALGAATSAQTYAEWWLTSSGGVNATTGTNCTAGSVTAPATVQICTAALNNPGALGWPSSVNYTPPGMQVGSAGVVNNYSNSPAFYISYLGGSFDNTGGLPKQTSSYQIDAVGYAGTANSAAVVESTYNVSVTYSSQSPPGPGKPPRVYLDHGRP